MRIPVYERRANISPLSMPNEQPHPLLSDNGQNVSQTLSDTFARFQKFSDDLEDTQTLEAFNKFKQDSQQYHEDPDTGIYQTRLGGRSFGVYKDADEWLRRKGEDYARQLPSNRAKQNFRKLAREHIQQRATQNSRFEAAEMRKYRQETSDATIRNALIFVGRHWDNIQLVEQARNEIAQALELKMRGSSQEAFKNAMTEWEDQIGITRITQAFAIHPLLGLNIFNDRKNTHLKPETRAKMLEYLKGKTEIYRMQGYIEQYAREFNPRQAEALRNILVARLGEDEGYKAFSAVSSYWSIQETQKRARKQAELEEQEHNEDIYLKKLANPEHNSVTIQEIQRDVLNNKIRPQFGLSVIARIEAEQKQAAADQQKKYKAAADFEMFRRENSGEYFTNEELEQGVKLGLYSDSEARQHKNSREIETRRKENERLQKTKDEFASKYYSGSLTVEDIDFAVDNDILDPNDAITFRNWVQRDQKLQTEETRKLFETGLRIIANNGGIIPHKTVNELLRPSDGSAPKISDTFAEYLWRHEDTFNQEQAQMQKAADTAQAKADKQTRKNELYKVAQNVFIQFGLGHEGEGLEEIQKLGLDVDELDFVRQHYNSLVQDAKTKQKNTDDELKAARKELVTGLQAQYMAEVNSLEQIKETREALEQMLNVDHSIEREEYNILKAILDEKERNYKEIANDKEDADNKDIAKDYFDRFGLEGIHQARKELGELYTDPKKIQGINTWLDRYERDARAQLSDEAKALREQQEQTFTDLRNNYWQEGKIVPAEELSRLEKSRGLSTEQVQRAHALNISITRKKGMEEALAQNPNTNWFNLSPTQREALVMQHLGTNEKQRRENVAYLFSKVLDGSSSDWEIMEYEASGRISGADVDTIKNFDKKFDNARKMQIRNVRREMEDMIKDLHNNKSRDYGAVLRDALIQFDNLTSQLDPRATDFEKSLKGYVQDTMLEVLKNFEQNKDLTSGILWWKWPSAAGERYQAIEQRLNDLTVQAVGELIPASYLTPEGLTQSITPTGETLPYSNTAPAVPQTPTPELTPTPASPDTFTIMQAVQAEQNPDNTNGDFLFSGQVSSSWQQAWPDNANSLQGMSDITKSILDGTAFRISSPFSATATKLRNGRGHLAVDCAVPVGTPVHSPQYGGLWKVIKTGQNSTAGKFVKIQSTLSSGDVHELTYAHLNSWDFQEGDTVSQGDIVARSGNTGHSTGPHLHVSLKVNGKPTDPTKVNINGGTAIQPGPTIQRAQFLPQPLEVIQRMTDEQAYNDFSGLLSEVLSNDNSSNIFTTAPNYGIPNYGAIYGGEYY